MRFDGICVERDATDTDISGVLSSTVMTTAGRTRTGQREGEAEVEALAFWGWIHLFACANK